MPLRSLTLGTVLASVLLASCGGDVAPIDVATSIAPSDLPSDRVAVLETRSATQGPDDKGNGWRIEYPFVSGIDPEAADAINSAIAVHLRLDDLALPPEADQTDGLTWFETVTYTPGLQTPQLLSVEFVSHLENGGAHGEPSTAALTFDLADGSPVTITDLLAEGALEVLSPLAKAQLDERHGEDHDATDQILFDDTTWAAGFDADGNLVLTFQPYSVGPYALGMPEVVFAPERLVELDLVPDGGPLAAALADAAA